MGNREQSLFPYFMHASAPENLSTSARLPWMIQNGTGWGERDEQAKSEVNLVSKACDLGERMTYKPSQG